MCYCLLVRAQANEALHKAALRLLAEKLFEEEADLSEEEEDQEEADIKDVERQEAVAAAAQNQGSLFWPELLASRRVLARIVAFSSERRRELETHVTSSSTDGGGNSTDNNATAAASSAKPRGPEDDDDDDDDDEFMDDENAGTGDAQLDTKVASASFSLFAALLLRCVRPAFGRLSKCCFTFFPHPLRC